jgi:arginyl-tRNA synthetase
MSEKGLVIADFEAWTDRDKAHFLGDGYVRGSKDYEDHKEEIDEINKKLYKKDPSMMPLYEKTRQWSLDYYDDLYRRFYTKYDRMFFESEVAECGKKIVEENTGKAFIRDNGAIIFPGEKYGLHTRVFVTQAGNPTYEGKEMCLAYKQYETFPFDKNIHVVANEQKGYFEVVIKALELIDPERFKGREFHLSMGMVQMVGRKMSSRTGDILTVDWLIDEVKNRVKGIITEQKISTEEADMIVEKITIGAIKYSVLRVGTEADVAFDIEKSVSLEGNSGPYLQYTYARTQSVLRKAEFSKHPLIKGRLNVEDLKPEELELLRQLVRFENVVGEAAERYAPNIVSNYLFVLAQAFNLFYQKLPILKETGAARDLRLVLTIGTGKVIRSGLELLGIQTPERM